MSVIAFENHKAGVSAARSGRDDARFVHTSGAMNARSILLGVYGRARRRLSERPFRAFFRDGGGDRGR